MKSPALPSLEATVARDPLDFNRTPAWVTQAIVPHLGEPRTVLDVGCGDGAIGRVLRQAWPLVDIRGEEVDPRRALLASEDGRLINVCTYNVVYEGDWLIDAHYPPYDLIISNPPFDHALPFLKLALERVAPGGLVAFLLPSQWDQETVQARERLAFLDSLRTADGREGYGKYGIEGRIAFRGGSKTDRIAYAWFLFGPGHEGVYRRVPLVAGPRGEQLALEVGNG